MQHNTNKLDTNGITQQLDTTDRPLVEDRLKGLEPIDVKLIEALQDRFKIEQQQQVNP